MTRGAGTLYLFLFLLSSPAPLLPFGKKERAKERKLRIDNKNISREEEKA